MKILVTGATGYLGSRLAIKLAEDDNLVHILVRNPDSPFIPNHKNIVVFKGDITDKETVIAAIKNCNQVYHTAALVAIHSKNRDQFYKVNVLGTENVLSAALQYGINKVVFTSSGGVIGASLHTPMTESDPRIRGFANDYELTKAMGENIVLKYCSRGLIAVIVNPTKIFGPGNTTNKLSINNIIKRFMKYRIFLCPSPSHFISNYVFIDDVLNGHINAMKYGLGGEKYIIGGENLSFKDFFKTIKTRLGGHGAIVPFPKGVAAFWSMTNWGLSMLSSREPLFTMDGVNHIFCNKAMSSEKAIRQLGYHITPFEEAISKTIHYLNQQS